MQCGALHYSTDACKGSTAKAVNGAGGFDSRSLTEIVVKEDVRVVPREETPGNSAPVARGGLAGRKDGHSIPAQAAKPLERAIPQDQVEPDDTSVPVNARSNTNKPNRNAYSAQYMREVYRPKLRAKKGALTTQAVN